MVGEIFFSICPQKSKQVSYSVFGTVIFSQQSVSHCVSGWVFLYFYTFLSSLHKIELFGILVVNLRNDLSNQKKKNLSHGLEVVDKEFEIFSAIKAEVPLKFSLGVSQA